jgi:hypothetical protein
MLGESLGVLPKSIGVASYIFKTLNASFCQQWGGLPPRQNASKRRCGIRKLATDGRDLVVKGPEEFPPKLHTSPGCVLLVFDCFLTEPAELPLPGDFVFPSLLPPAPFSRQAVA